MERSRMIPVCLLMMAACGEDETEPAADAQSSDGPTDAADVLDGSSADTEGSAPVVPLVCEEGVAVRTVEGRVQSPDGAVISDARGQVCVRSLPGGRLTCLRPQPVDPEGRFVVTVPADVGCFERVVMRVFDAAAGHAPLYCELPLTAVDGEQRLVAGEGLTLLPVVDPVDRPEAPADPTQLSTVTFAGDLRVDIRPSALLDGAGFYDELRGQRYDPAEVDLCFIPEDAELWALWGFAPETDVTGENLALTVPNEWGLEPGDTVSIWLLGGIGTTVGRAGFVDEGDFRAVTRGQVSEDGLIIRSEQGVPAFTWLGIGPDIAGE